MNIQVDLSAILSAGVVGMFIVLGFLLKNRLYQIDRAIEDLYNKINMGMERTSKLEGINEAHKHDKESR